MPIAAIRASQGAAPLIAPVVRPTAGQWRLGLYVALVIIGGAALLGRFTPADVANVPLALALLCGSLLLSTFKLRLPVGQGVSTMSMACAADLLTLLMLGPDVAMLTSAAGVLLQCTIRVRRSQPIYRAAFSIAAVIITVQAAGLMWYELGGDLGQPTALFVPLLAAVFTYFVVNTVLVATAVSLSSGRSAFMVWQHDFLWSAPSYLISGAAAGIVALIVAHQQYVLLPVAFVPLYVSYRAYQLSLRRIEEERRHAAELTQMVSATQAALTRATESEAALAAEKERLVLESSRLTVTVQTIRDGVMMVDRGGSILLMNDEARRLLGSAPDPSNPRPMKALLTQLGFEADAVGAALRQLWDQGQAVRLVNDVVPDGRVPLVEVTGTPTHDADGQVAGAVWVLRDLTDIARAEQQRAKAAHLESLGVLAGGLAHDFNNILMGAVGNLSLAQDLVPPDQEALRTRLRHAANACARARGVTSQLLTFAKGGAPIKTTASVRELVIECTRFVLSGSAVAARFDIAHDVWAADIDTNQVAQVLHNLVLNAIQAMPQGGRIDLTVRNVDLSPETVPPAAGLRPGRYVALSVQDCGVGIAPEHLNRIFDPYFTTKEKGSGLGLAISYSIVRAHGGAITVSSPPGHGATFTVYLPASMNEVVDGRAPQPTGQRRSGGMVLLMDDDAMVAEVAQEMLHAVGFATEIASDGEDAIRRFQAAEEGGTPFNLVILDLTVPGGMGGAEAVARIRAIRSGVTVFVTSGYADDDVLARFRDYGFDGVLPKPFTVPDLRRTLGRE